VQVFLRGAIFDCQFVRIDGLIMQPPIVRKPKAPGEGAKTDAVEGSSSPGFTSESSTPQTIGETAVAEVVSPSKTQRASRAKHEPVVIDAEAQIASSDEADGERATSDDAEPAEIGLDDIPEVEPATDQDLELIYGQIAKAPAPGVTSTTALAVRDPLGAYMAEVRRYPLLTREEEYELAKIWVENNDAEAGRRLVTSNLRLVVKIANEYRRGYQNLLDLVQEGNVGLVKAVQKFDPYRGVKLSTYAGWWIRAYILKYILDTWRLVKVGTTQNQRKLFFNLRKQRDALQAAGIEPTAEEIAKALDVSTEEVVEMQKRLGAPDQSLDAPVNESDEGSRSRIDLVEGHEADPEDQVGSSQFMHLLSDRLRRFGQTLRGRELEIFEERVIADEPITLQELGDRWGVSRERARQLEKRMVTRLREFLQEELGDAVQVALGHD
jgi:RNA polymerase sigma-32 factor